MRTDFQYLKTLILAVIIFCGFNSMAQEKDIYAKGDYKNGHKSGYWEYFEEDGQLQSAGNYLKGNKEGVWHNYLPGNILFERNGISGWQDKWLV